MGRPLTDIDEEDVARLALQGARNSEIAFILGVDDETISARFSRLLNKKRAERRLSLRRMQMEKAQAGDTTMLIWLGKNELDQSDKVEQKSSGIVEREVHYVNDWRNPREGEDPQRDPRDR